MEEDTVFELLKENVELARKKIRKCMVETENKAETKISWNAIWNELQKTDWLVSTELTQRLKVWYLLRDPAPKSSEPKTNLVIDSCDKQENRDLSHTLPAFMIESLVQPGDRWDQDAANKITSNKPSSDQQRANLGRQQQQDAVQDFAPPRECGVDPNIEYHTEVQSRDQSFNFPCSPQPERMGYLSPKPTPLSSSNYQSHYTTCQRQSNRRFDFEPKHRALKKEHWCPPGNFPRVDCPPFIPRSRKMITQRNWNSEAEAKGFSSQSNYRVKPSVPRRSSSNHFELRPVNMENPNAEGVPWRPPSQQWQLRRMPVDKPALKPGRPRRSSSQKYNLRRMDKDNHKGDKPFFTPRAEPKPNASKKWKYKLRAAFQKQKKQHPNRQRDGRGKPKGPIFPPRDYSYQNGDWVVHAIVSLSVKPTDIRLALEKRGYELKYITKRKCKIKDKWVCSLIANADRTHVLTSENIWVNSWEVEFVCKEEEIAKFLLK